MLFLDGTTRPRFSLNGAERLPAAQRRPKKKLGLMGHRENQIRHGGRHQSVLRGKPFFFYGGFIPDYLGAANWVDQSTWCTDGLAAASPPTTTTTTPFSPSDWVYAR